MASVVPSIILAIVVAGVIIALFGGIVQYYSTIYSEPALLPAYGSIYVSSVDPDLGIVSIVNKYGYPVKALFSIKVTIPNTPSGTEVPDTITFWVTLRPGITEVNVYEKAKQQFGKNVRVDLSRSYFVIGNLKYPLQKGAGALEPSKFSLTGSNEYTASGLGTSSFGLGKGFATIYFDGDTLKFTFTTSNNLGYKRSISEYETRNLPTEKHYGYKCNYYTETYSGSELKSYECINWTCYQNCINNGGSPDECRSSCNTTCWDCFNCSKTLTLGYRYYFSTETNYKTFECARDGIISYYWTPSISKTIEKTFKTAALLGFTQFTRDYAIDFTTYDITGTSLVSKPWPYILDDQSACYYNYYYYRYVANTWTSYTYICDSTCGHLKSYQNCSYFSYLERIERRWACGYMQCASTATFLYGKLDYGTLNITSYLTSGKSIKLEANITLVFSYYKYYDKELADTYIRLLTDNLLKLSLPKIKGYFSIPYTDNVKSVEVILHPSVSYKAYIKTTSGYEATAYLLVSAKDQTFPVIYSPVGYIGISDSSTENAKTYYFEIGATPEIEISFKSPYSGLTAPLHDNDKIILNIILEITLTPKIIVETVIAS